MIPDPFDAFLNKSIRQIDGAQFLVRKILDELARLGEDWADF
jgi:hypothetical protein